MAAKTQSTTPFAACAAEVKVVGGIVALKQGVLLFELRGPISVHEPANHEIECPLFVYSLAAMIYQVPALRWKPHSLPSSLPRPLLLLLHCPPNPSLQREYAAPLLCPTNHVVD